MSHYEERLAHDLGEIRRSIAELEELLGHALDDSVSALLTRNRDLAALTVLRDQIVNRKVRRLDRLCHAFTATHLPSAGHLRFVSSVLRINIALERIGDYACTISRETTRITQELDGTLRRDVDRLVREARQALRQSVKAFVSQNAELAKGTRAMASNVGKEFDNAFQDLLEVSSKGDRPILDLFALLMVLNRLSRICDQAKNICEETIFAASGEPKRAKKFRILVIDETNDRWSPMAEGVGRRLFGARAIFASAGWNPASRLDDEMIRLMKDKGIDIEGIQPSRLQPLPERLDDFHVLIDLAGDLSRRLTEVPYHLIVLNWSKAIKAAGEPPSLEEAFKRLQAQLEELADILVGDSEL